MNLPTPLLILVGLVVAYWPVRVLVSYILYRIEVYKADQAQQRFEADERKAADAERARQAWEAEKERAKQRQAAGLPPEPPVGLTGCGGAWNSFAHAGYDTRAQDLLRELMTRVNSAPPYQQQERWPIQDPVTGQWRMETEEEAKERRQK